MAQVLRKLRGKDGLQLQRGLNTRHHMLLDFFVRCPQAKDYEAAEVLGFSPGYVSQVTRSDAFQVELHDALAQARERALSGLEEKAAKVLHKSLDQTLDRLSVGPVSERLLNDTNATLLKALGFGQLKSPKDVAAQQHVHVHVSAEDIANARARRAERAGATPAKLELVAGAERPERRGDDGAAARRAQLSVVE